jgi:hypothetical protein
VVRVACVTVVDLRVRRAGIDPHIGFCYNETIPHNESASWSIEAGGVSQGTPCALAVNIEPSQRPPPAKALLRADFG